MSDGQEPALLNRPPRQGWSVEEWRGFLDGPPINLGLSHPSLQAFQLPLAMPAPLLTWTSRSEAGRIYLIQVPGLALRAPILVSGQMPDGPIELEHARPIPKLTIRHPTLALLILLSLPHQYSIEEGELRIDGKWATRRTALIRDELEEWLGPLSADRITTLLARMKRFLWMTGAVQIP